MGSVADPYGDADLHICGTRNGSVVSFRRRPPIQFINEQYLNIIVRNDIV